MTQETIFLIVRIFTLLIVLFLLFGLSKFISRNLHLFFAPKVDEKAEPELKYQELHMYFAIRPRVAAMFNGSEIGKIVRRQGFRPSEQGQYCLFKNFQHDEIFCYLFKDGAKLQAVFDKDLQEKSKMSGLILLLKLPNCGNLLRCEEDFHNFYTIVQHIAQHCDGRIYVYLNNRQLLLNNERKQIYNERVANFQEYCYSLRNQSFAH